MAEPGQAADFAPVDVRTRRRDDGAILVNARQPLSPHPATVLEWLADAADRHSTRALLCERDGRHWRKLDYGSALNQVEAAAGAWLERGLVPGARVLVLAPNGAGHLVASLSALRAGLVSCPLPARLAHGGAALARLTEIAEAVTPAAVFVDEPGRCPEAVQLFRERRVPIASLTSGKAVDIDLSRSVGATLPPLPGRADPARIIFTSGSVGAPKGVLYTHGMMTSNLQMTLDLWPFLRKQPQVLVDWLPWHHVFGGNNNINLILALAGTLYVDGGSPLPAGLPQTLENLREVAPTLYCGVPAGLTALLPHLQSDTALRENFYSRLQAIFSAGAALAAPTATALATLGQTATGRPVHIVSGWGATETGPGATLVHRPSLGALNIGTPTPGTTLKLVPSQGRYELRVRGPSVTTGYFGRPDLTREAFDEEGFYRTGDAGRFEDDLDPSRGLVFDGRLAEDFKLGNGSWVSAGVVRLDLLRQCAGLVRDAVVCAPNRPHLAALVWLASDPTPEVLHELRQRLADAIAGSATTQVRRLMVLNRPPSMEQGEINDKGYVNQGRCLHTRAADIERLYQDPSTTVMVAQHQELFAC
jgi:feruloyl-CoA synthase